MKKKTLIPSIMLLLFVMIVIQACGGAKEGATQETPSQPEVQSMPTIPLDTEVPAGLVTNLTDLKKATIQIEGQGTFIDPQFGYMANQAGFGSGFIIDPSGLAVTNNHVVTGAALLKVWIGGDTNNIYNARVLGASECSDLAVIDIEGDGFPYLSWYEEPAKVGLEVYAAGFPLGDPEYTMTKGIVSKEKADGETSWASVDSVIEHTSRINPGNSGGPLVDADGKVVGVNYAGSSTTNQYFAIDRKTALKVIELLKAGIDVESIGINGEAVSSEDGSLSGIWVSSVESGSAADKAGVKPGDVITQLEKLDLATDGTMKDYCDILRSHTPGDPLALQVLRWDTQEVLEGQLNGPALETVYNFSEVPPDTGTSEPSGTDTGSIIPDNCEASTAPGYNTCWDDTATIQVDVPDYWTDFNGGSWTYKGTDIGVAISAAPSLSDFSDSYSAEGVFFGASDTFAQKGGYIQFLDYYTNTYRGHCDYEGRFDYADSLYRGKYDQYSNCDGTGGYDAYVLSVVDKVDQFSKIILIEIQTYPGDTAVKDQIFATFYVDF
jgi:serine protease Do